MKVKIKTVLVIEDNQGKERFQTPINNEVMLEDNWSVKTLIQQHCASLGGTWDELKKII